ncbi:molybdopterin-dependent oxidoreductase [Raoultella ornithinolytica]|uniref:molybdopterin-dependent oxidoreductase n=1 Tax=Raoultella ornithinolytica TaxID=54291 RepID=UPI0025B4C6F5|nr:molybdopterin-dependent oxidoreductase [Raoultella ornithinolytica]MDN3782782.1 molybdopterin-dependent oxidoreductase [Raoultella ornithinolytica]
MIRRQRGGKLESVSWEEALDYVATRLSAIKAKYGRRHSDHWLVPRDGNETNYVMQKLARAVIGTNNVDCCAPASDTALGCRSAPVGR